MSVVNATTAYVQNINNAPTTFSVGNATSNVTITTIGVENFVPNNETSMTPSSGTSASTTETTDPFGGLNSWKFTENTSNNYHYCISTSNINSLQKNTLFLASIYLKYSSRKYVALQLQNSTSGIFITVDLTNGTIILDNQVFGSALTFVSRQVTSVGNGWYKLVVIGNNQLINDNISITMVHLNDTPTSLYTGNGTAATYFYGPQLAISTDLNEPYFRTSGSAVYKTFNVGSNVTINSYAISVGNATVNTVLTPSALTTNSITIGATTYTTIPSYANVYNYQSFTTTGWSSWTKPAGTTSNDLVTIMMWGGGGGSFGNATVFAGGGGGACVILNLLASQCNATCNVYVASGGNTSSTLASVTQGQTSLFYTNSTFSISAYGGGQANVTSSTVFVGGGGGGWFGSGSGSSTTSGGGPLGGANGATSTFGGGGGANSSVNPGRSVYGGGGGGNSSISTGTSIYGGGGGGGGSASIFGGRGGNTTVEPTAPGGGGGIGNGARGEIRVWVQKVG